MPTTSLPLRADGFACAHAGQVCHSSPSTTKRGRLKKRVCERFAGADTFCKALTPRTLRPRTSTVAYFCYPWRRVRGFSQKVYLSKTLSNFFFFFLIIQSTRFGPSTPRISTPPKKHFLIAFSVTVTLLLDILKRQSSLKWDWARVLPRHHGERRRDGGTVDILQTRVAPARLTRLRGTCGVGAHGEALLSRSAGCGVVFDAR